MQKRHRLLSSSPRRSCLGRLLIPLSGPSAAGPVAHLPPRLVKVAACTVPVDPQAEVLVARRLASGAVAEAPIPPVVIATTAASPISMLPLLAWNPIRAMCLLSNLPSRGRVCRRLRPLRRLQGLRRQHGQGEGTGVSLLRLSKTARPAQIARTTSDKGDRCQGIGDKGYGR